MRGGLASPVTGAETLPRGELTLSRGSRVAVFRLTPAPILEGWAVIDRPASGEYRFLVRFAGDPIVRERFIHPDWQAEPERALALLQQLWRAEATLAIADFFPDDAS